MTIYWPDGTATTLITDESAAEVAAIVETFLDEAEHEGFNNLAARFKAWYGLGRDGTAGPAECVRVFNCPGGDRPAVTFQN